MADDLLSKLERAEGADREIDKELWLALTPGSTRRSLHINHWKSPYDIDETRDPSGRLITAPAYTASLDAALALVERVLPSGHDDTRSPPRESFGWTKRLSERFDWNWEASVYRVADGLYFKAVAPTPALALCIALLRALKASEQT